MRPGGPQLRTRIATWYHAYQAEGSGFHLYQYRHVLKEVVRCTPCSAAAPILVHLPSCPHLHSRPRSCCLQALEHADFVGVSLHLRRPMAVKHMAMLVQTKLRALGLTRMITCGNPGTELRPTCASLAAWYFPATPLATTAAASACFFWAVASSFASGLSPQKLKL